MGCMHGGHPNHLWPKSTLEGSGIGTRLGGIPDICHLDHLHVGGEKICHVEKFQISIHEISPHEEEFQFYHTTDVEKCEILPNLEKFHISPQDRCEEI